MFATNATNRGLVLIQMRPGIKVKMWSPRFKNRPEVEPPGLLKAIGGMSFFSVVGVLVYAVGQSVIGIGTLETRGIAAAYIALLHFVLPFGVFYTISVNSPLSRIVIAAYAVILCAATIAGKGFLGALEFDETLRNLFAVVALFLVFSWLFGSPKMRFYYALISNKPVPSDLVSRAADLSGGSWLSPKARGRLAWFLDHMETIVLVGFMLAAIYAFISTSNL